MTTVTVLLDVKSAQQRLQKLAGELRQEISAELLRGDEELYADIAGRVHDTADESVADLLADLNFATIDRQITELRAVEAALLRISMGSYDVCESCGESIGTARLNAQPAAYRCLQCQTRIEHAQGTSTPPKL